MSNLLNTFGNTFQERVSRAIKDIASGKGVLLVDDENRENEGDIIFAAENLTVPGMAMMIRECSGIVCLCITEERAKQVNFSIPYFASGQQFIAKKGTLTSPEQIGKLRIGVDKGTTNEIVLREKFPTATLVAYDDTPFAFTALRNGNVQAVTQDGPKLIALLANAPDKDKYEIPPFSVSDDLIGAGIAKGETRLTEFVNQTLRELESSGKAQKIYDAWFGPTTKTPLKRIFKIGDK